MTVSIKWRKQYDEDEDAKARAATDIHCEDESLTVQDAPDADINVLMARMGIKDGSILPADLNITAPGYYGDLTDIPDMQEALARVHEAEDRFMELPAKIRARFNNRPFELHMFINNPENYDEAVTLGLLQRVAKRATTNDTTGTNQPQGDTNGTRSQDPPG